MKALKLLNKMKISTKFNFLLVSVILFLSIIIGLVVHNQITKVMEQVFTDRVKIVSELGYNWLNESYQGEWVVKDGILYKGNTKINNNNELLDMIGNITGGAVTIFEGETRVATNVVNEGQRVIGTKVSQVVKDIVLKTGQPYVGEADIIGKRYLTMYQPIKDKDGEVIGMWLVGSHIDIINNTTFSLLIKLITVLVIVGFITIFCSIILIRSIIRPIIDVNKQLVEISEGEGDLTKELSVKHKDEIGDLANSFNKMLSSLRTMIGQTSHTSEQVAAASEELTASVELTTQAMNQISTSIQELASGAEIQGQKTEQSSHAMSEVTINVQQVADTASSVSKLAHETNNVAKIGNESLQKVILQMNNINLSAEETAAVIKQLGERSKEIGTIIEVITNISEQTNLLALNAAIEAARAGENGKGFSVVADEVRKLAEQSNESANQIIDLIQEIQSGTALAIESMGKGAQEVEVGMGVVLETREGFQKIVKSIEHVSKQIQEVSSISEKMSANVKEVNESLKEVSNIARSSVSNTENVAAASEEQLATMDDISSSAISLSSMAEELRMIVGKFKI